MKYRKYYLAIFFCLLEAAFNIHLAQKPHFEWRLWLCCIWWRRGIRLESAGCEDDLLSVILFCFWLCRADDLLKRLPHAVIWFLSSVDSVVSSQICRMTESLVTVWTLVRFFWCRFKQLGEVNVFSHSKHMYSLTPACLFWCSLKFCREEKRFPHK